MNIYLWIINLNIKLKLTLRIKGNKQTKQAKITTPILNSILKMLFTIRNIK